MIVTPLHALGSTRFTSSVRVAVLALLIAGCGGDSGPETIDRDVFVETYADLRIAAVQTDSQRIAVADRDSILAAHGVSAADLERFAEVHSVDLDFMRDVWNDVEQRMDRSPEVSN